LDKKKIDKIRRPFGANTAAGPIQKALQKILDDQEVQESLDKLLSEGRFRTIYR
jgi:hypothetical protein